MSRIHIAPEFDYVVNHRTGELHILYDEIEIAEQEEMALNNARQDLQARVRATGGKLDFDKDWALIEGNFKAAYDRQRADQETARSRGHVEHFRMTLAIPTHEEDLRARTASTTHDSITGQTIFDDAGYANRVFEAAYRAANIPASDVSDLHPVIGRELASRIASACAPDRRRLPFASSTR
jgi:hypothetical protein